MVVHKLVKCSLLATGAALAFSAPIHAMAQESDLNLPAQPLGNALRAIAQPTGTNILFVPEAVRGLQAPSLNGKYTPREAVRQLLRDTNLFFTVNGDGTIMVRSSSSLAPEKASFQPTPPDAIPAKPAYSVEEQIGRSKSTPVEEQIGLEEIIVTAQRREESLQDSPVSVAVLGSAELEARGIASFDDLFTGTIPSVRVSAQTGRRSAYNIGMRGITSGDPTSISRDPAVGIYIDGVYLGRLQGLGTEMLDIERIEALRGPQGTLFGRNAVGGAVNIVTKRPSGYFDGVAVAGIGNFGLRTLRVSLDLPETANLSVKLSGVISSRDGTVDNPQPDQWDWAQSRKSGVGIQALWRPADDLDILYSFDRSRAKTSSYYPNIASIGPNFPLPPLFDLEPDRVKTARIGSEMSPSVADVEGHSLNATWNVSDHLTLRSITAYRKMSQTGDDNDLGYTTRFAPNANFARRSLAWVNQDQFSQELQILGTYDNFEYIAGAYYFDENASDGAHVTFMNRWNNTGTSYIVLDPPIGGTFPDRASRNHVRSTALFGQATYTPPVLDERLHLTAGLRYTKDRKNGSLYLLRGAPSSLAYKFGSERLDPAATVAFDISDNVNMYGRYAVAYRAGGANSRSAIFRTFNEDVAHSIEAGLKSEFWDRRGRLNFTIFSVEYRDLQVDVSNPATIGNVDTINAGTAKVRGLEAEFSLVPVRNLILNASYNYLHTILPPQYNPFTNMTQVVNMPSAPKHAGNVSARYSVSLGDPTLSFHTDASFASRAYNVATNPASTKPYFTTNGRITLSDIPLGKGPELSISAWVKNLTNENVDAFRAYFSGSGIEVAAFSDPRTFGIEAKLEF